MITGSPGLYFASSYVFRMSAIRSRSAAISAGAGQDRAILSKRAALYFVFSYFAKARSRIIQ